MHSRHQSESKAKHPCPYGPYYLSQSVALPSFIRERAQDIQNITEDLYYSLNREPTLEDVANFLDVPVEEVIWIDLQSQQDISLNQRVPGTEYELIDLIHDQPTVGLVLCEGFEN